MDSRQLIMNLLFTSKVILKFVCRSNKILFRLGKPLIYIQESNEQRSSINREFECQVYSSSSILVCLYRNEISINVAFFRKSVGD